MSKIGVNTWVWTSPVTTDEFARLAPHVARMGFDVIEVGIESTSDLDYRRGAAVIEIARALDADLDQVEPHLGDDRRQPAELRRIHR